MVHLLELIKSYELRINKSGRSMIYDVDHTSETLLVIVTCGIPNKREYFYAYNL